MKSNNFDFYRTTKSIKISKSQMHMKVDQLSSNGFSYEVKFNEDNIVDSVLEDLERFISEPRYIRKVPSIRVLGRVK